MAEFKINDYLTLKLKGRETVIYVADEKFIECKFLLISIPIEEVSSFDNIESIDAAAERLDESMELDYDRNLNISYEEEFWAHCSNLQVWVEHDYDTRLLQRNLAFPLLKALVEAGDLNAKLALKEEIALRMESGDLKVIIFLLEEEFIKYLEREEQELFFYDSNKRLRKNIEFALKGENSSRKYALLALKELAELGDETAKRISIEEFHKKLKEGNFMGSFNNSREHDLLVRNGYYEYLDRKTMLFTLLEKADAEVILKLDQLIDKRWLEFKARLDYETAEKYPDSYRKRLILKPNVIFDKGSGVKLESYEFEVMGKRVIDLCLRPCSDLRLVSFPELVLELTALKELDLSSNRIAEIPEGISSLKKLKVLHFRSTGLGLLPESIGELESLEKLNLDSNSIKELPSSIGRLRSLKKLSMNNNKLQHLPESIEKLESLEILSLYGNNIQILPESIVRLISLEHLDIAHNKLASLPKSILNLKSLSFIHIDSTQKDLYPLQILKKKGVKISTL